MSGSAVQTPAPPEEEETRGGPPALQVTNPVLRGIALFENVFMLILLIATVATVLAQVFFRYALSKPLSWSTEVATDLLVYVAFVGFAIGIRDNTHVAMRLFESRFGVGPRRWLRITELVVLGIVLGCLGVGGTIYSFEQSDVVSQSGIPVWATFLPLPIGAVLGSVHIIVEIVALLRGAEPPSDGHGAVDDDPADAPPPGAQPAAAPPPPSAAQPTTAEPATKPLGGAE